MTGCESKVSKIQWLLSPQGLMSQLISRIHLNPKEVGSNPTEGMDVLARRGQAGKERKLPFPMSLHRLAGVGVARITGMSSHLKV